MNMGCRLHDAAPPSVKGSPMKRGLGLLLSLGSLPALAGVTAYLAKTMRLANLGSHPSPLLAIAV